MHLVITDRGKALIVNLKTHPKYVTSLKGGREGSNNMKKLVIISLSAIALAGCFAKKKTTSTAAPTPPTQADVDRVASIFPAYTLAELNEGKALFEANCGTCHALPKPTAETESEWRRIVPDMARKMNKNGMLLDAQKEDRILKYVITMSKR